VISVSIPLSTGMAGTPLKRFLPPAYANGIDLPRSKSVTGADLPNPRTISASFMTENKQEEAIWTHIFTTFGQFLTHDLAETALVSNGGSKPSCPCGSTDTHTCSSFSLPSTTSGRPAVTTADVLGTCLQFVRSAGSFPDLSNCQRTYREQVFFLMFLLLFLYCEVPNYNFDVSVCDIYINEHIININFKKIYFNFFFDYLHKFTLLQNPCPWAR
jgi:hypothetical protein